MKAKFTEDNFGCVRIETLVTIPSDPSLPINKCFKSYPVLSLRKVPSMSSTLPFAVTASRPEMKKIKMMRT
jgi:hypothetical protein